VLLYLHSSASITPPGSWIEIFDAGILNIHCLHDPLHLLSLSWFLLLIPIT